MSTIYSNEEHSEYDHSNGPFTLENSKYGNLQKFKSAVRQRVDMHSPQEIKAEDLLSIKSDETGRVPVDDYHAKSCQSKKKEHVTTEDYLKTRAAEMEEFNVANLHSVESLAPFNLRRVYGRLEDVPAINLTGIYKNHIVYASSNVIIVYDFVDNFQKCLQGHRNRVTSLKMERQGRFFVTTDAGKKNMSIVWETMTGKPLKFFPNTHEGHGSIYACFTGMDFIFASIGAEELGEQTISLWNFEPKEKSKASILTGSLPKTTSVIRELSFLDQRPEFFSATGDRNVIFGTWIRDKKGDAFHFHKPKLRKAFIAKHKRFSSSLWMNDGEWLATATGAGYVVIWGPPLVLGLEDPPDPSKNIREYQRSFKLCEDGITVFQLYKEYVVIGDEIGIVRFFDHEFKLLRWSRNFSLPGIHSISFNRTEDLPDFKKTFRKIFNGEEPKNPSNKSRVKDYTLGGNKFKMASKTTMPRPPMPCPDFILGVSGGNVYYYHFHESQLDLLVPGTPGSFIACDVCPGSNHILFATVKGEIQLYNFKDHQLVFNDKIFVGNHQISCMKFHPMGQIIAFGLVDGHVCFRWTYTWKTAMQPMFLTTAKVIRIIYSSDGLHLAYYDTNQTVVVLKYLPKGHGWLVLGKSRAHFLPILDLQFFLDPEQQRQRLFSIGQDRHLIEYDVDRSSEETGLFIVKITSLEQTCRPTAMIFDGPIEFGVDCITFSNDINKIRMFSYEDEKVRRTCSGPVFGREKGISRMVEFPAHMSQQRLKKFIVYIVKNKLGIMDTPVDGNPHKYMAVFTHPKDIIDLAVVTEKEKIFTIGKQDNSAFVWDASARAVEATVLMGGSGLTPFYYTLRRHWGGACQDVIKDLDMIFFFLNVKRIDKQTELYTMNRNIRLCEISAVCRACCFYPSEYEIGLMMDEARRLKQADQHYTDDFTTEYSFDEFVKLFVNHFYRTTDEDIEESFKVLGFHNEGDEYPYICRTDLVTYLTTEGEKISQHNFPIFFEPMYGVRKPGEFGNVQCHLVTKEPSSDESSFSLSSSSSTEEIPNETLKSSSDSSLSREDDEEVEAENNVEEEEEMEDTTENKIRDDIPIEDGDEGNRTSRDENRTSRDENRTSRDENRVSRDENRISKESLTPPMLGKKTIKLNLPDEYDDDGNAVVLIKDEIKGEEEDVEGNEDQEADDNELIDIPERVDFMYFLEQIVPADSQQTIRWKSKIEPLKGPLDKDNVTKRRQKEEKEFLNSILKQVVDPNYPIPRKLLNALYAEYYMQHGNFSVPPDLRYPGIPLPGDNWYNEADDDEEAGSSSATSLTTNATDMIPGDNADEDDNNEMGGEGYIMYGEDGQLLGEDGKLHSKNTEDTITISGELDGEGSTEGHTETIVVNSDDISSDNKKDSTPVEAEADVEAEPLTSNTVDDLLGEFDEEDDLEGEVSPPFTVSEFPDTATTDPTLKNDYETDGTEEMTDLENVYEQEDLDFVRNVNETFRPNEDKTKKQSLDIKKK